MVVNTTPLFLKTKTIVLLSLFLEVILLYFYYYPEVKLLFGDESRYLNTGIIIAQGGDWHPNPLWPPMQGILIALFSKVFTNPIFPLQVFQYLMLILAGIIVKDIVLKETHNQLASQASLAVMLLYPSWLAYSQYLWPEVIHVTLLASLFWIVNYRCASLKWMAFSGFLLGLMILFKSLIILFIPFLYFPLFFKLEIKQALSSSFLSFIIAVIVLMPASFKAHEMTGSWMVSNSSMFNLMLGLSDDKRQHFSNKLAGKHYQEYIASARSYKYRNKISKQKSLEKIKSDGYITTFFKQLSKQYFRLFDYQTFLSQQFTNTENKSFVNKYNQKSNHWFVKTILYFNSVFYFIVFLGMVLGALISVKKSLLSKQLLLFLFYVLALFLLLHSIPRFRIPLVPIMAINTAFLVDYLTKYKNINFTIKKVTLLVVIVTTSAILLFSSELIDEIFPI